MVNRNKKFQSLEKMPEKPKLSELKLIRLLLEKKQREMGPLLGGVPQSTYQWWETNPDKPESIEALEKAKALYEAETGFKWVNFVQQPPEVVSARVQWCVEGVNRALLLLQDLDQRLRQVENPEGETG